jgi:hypothetical protein
MLTRCAKSHLPLHDPFVASRPWHHLLGSLKSLKTSVIQMNRIRGLPSAKEDELPILGYFGIAPHPDINVSAHFAIGQAVLR